MLKLHIYAILSSCLLLVLGCETTPPERAFYHWQTKLALVQEEVKLIDSLGIQKLYIKFFDVDWDAERQTAVPQASLIGQVDLLEPLVIVPTVFITNRTLANIDLTEVTELALRISEKVQTLANGYAFQTWQIDCDWTLSTRDKYFLLLKTLKTQLPDVELTATLRLHQAKFPQQTGVPPVDRAMLMYYNMGDIEAWESENSIFESDIGAQYVESLKSYALPMDVALPIFQWGLLFRDSKLSKIVNNLAIEDLADNNYYQKIGEGRYHVEQSTYLSGHYLYEGDQIRLESITPEDLQQIQEQLEIYLPKENRTIALYHLDEKTLARWQLKDLEAIFEAFE